MNSFSEKAFQAFSTIVSWYPYGYDDTEAGPRISARFVDEFIANLPAEKRKEVGGSYTLLFEIWRTLGLITPTHSANWWEYTRLGLVVAPLSDPLPESDTASEETSTVGSDGESDFSVTLPVDAPCINFNLEEGLLEVTPDVEFQLDEEATELPSELLQNPKFKEKFGDKSEVFLEEIVLVA